MAFPHTRMRRLRKNETVRRLVRETAFTVDDLIYPVFVAHGEDLRRPVKAMPGVFNYSVDVLVEELKQVAELGLSGVLVFGLPRKKDALGSEAYDENGIVQRAVRAIKSNIPQMLVITDICLCEYTDHGHCGIVENGKVLNDPTLELLAKTAVSHARAGADMVAPSDMMDGRIGVVRSRLDMEGYHDVPVMSYAAKYASAYYGPFREAAGSAPKFGDRGTYQMDPANAGEALREIKLDLEEGADIVMVKPALAYLDVVRRVKETFFCPLAAYNVSGEYAMVKAAAAKGYVDEKNIVLENMTAIKRAGADIIITYHAPDVALWLEEMRAR